MQIFQELSRIIERIEAPETHQSNNLGLTLAAFWNKFVALTQSWIIQALVVLVTRAILATLVVLVKLAMFVVALPPPSLGVRLCSPGGCRLDSHRTVPNIFRYWLDYESCLGSVSASSVICGFVAYYVNGGVDFFKHVVLDMCLYLTNHRTPIASRVNWHVSRFFLLAISMVFPRSRMETAQKTSKIIVGETKNKTRCIIKKCARGYGSGGCRSSQMKFID